MLGIRHEFIWKHAPEQNGHVGSFHGTLKKEYVWPHDFARFQDAEVVLAKAFVDYNENRIHSALGHITPSEFVCKLDGGNKWGTDSFGKKCRKWYQKQGPRPQSWQIASKRRHFTDQPNLQKNPSTLAVKSKRFCVD